MNLQTHSNILIQLLYSAYLSNNDYYFYRFNRKMLMLFDIENNRGETCLLA